jgi:hypothetical protein
LKIIKIDTFFLKLMDLRRNCGDPWGSAEMAMEEEYSLKCRMRTEMRNTLNDGARSSKVLSGQSPIC